jgi:glutamine amidotransferase
MCRLFAIAGALKQKTEKEALKNFQKLAETGCVPAGVANGHNDGWGIAVFAKGRIVRYERRVEDASASTTYNNVVSALQKIDYNALVAHLRKASVGGRAIENTHPFRYNNFVFAHNGTIFDHQKIPLSAAMEQNLQGTTDSERFFYYIMEKHLESPTQPMEQVIHGAAQMVRMNLCYRSLNFILSDGKQLWVERDVNENDERVKEKNLLDYYTLYRAKIGSATMICSEKIISENWELIPNHELVSIIIK